MRIDQSQAVTAVRGREREGGRGEISVWGGGGQNYSLRGSKSTS